jgi:hypothetical protein
MVLPAGKCKNIVKTFAYMFLSPVWVPCGLPAGNNVLANPLLTGHRIVDWSPVRVHCASTILQPLRSLCSQDQGLAPSHSKSGTHSVYAGGHTFGQGSASGLMQMEFLLEDRSGVLSARHTTSMPMCSQEVWKEALQGPCSRGAVDVRTDLAARLMDMHRLLDSPCIG